MTLHTSLNIIISAITPIKSNTSLKIPSINIKNADKIKITYAIICFLLSTLILIYFLVSITRYIKKDNSGRLCDEWAKKSNKIKAVHKKNAGLGMARNTGLEHVTGNYVMFIDSDDYLAENVVEKLLEKLLTEKVDAAFTGMIRFNDDKILSEVDRKYKDNTFRENELCEKYLMEMAGTLPDEPIDSYLYMSVCTGLYSMKVIKDYSIQFESERKMISEDFIFNIDYFSIAKGVTFIAENGYYYRVNENSLTRSYNPKRFEMEIAFFEEINRKFSKLLQPEIYELRVQRMFIGRVRTCILWVITSVPKRKFQEINKICNNEVVKRVMKTYPYNKNPFRQRVFNACLRHRFVIGLYVLGEIALLK